MNLAKIKFGLLILISLLIYSCGQSTGWTKQEKEDFVKGCVKSNKGKVSDEQAKVLCDCMLSKMVDKYPTMQESQKMKREKIKEIAVSCINSNKKEVKNDTISIYKTKDKKVGFVLKGWTDTKLKVHDLQCTNQDANMSVYVHNIKDFKSKMTKKDLLSLYVKNIMAKRINAKEEEGFREIKEDGVRIYQSIYTADTETTKNMYCFNIIDFGEDKNICAFVLFTALPSYGEKNIEEWNNILKAAITFE